MSSNVELKVESSSKQSSSLLKSKKANTAQRYENRTTSGKLSAIDLTEADEDSVSVSADSEEELSGITDSESGESEVERELLEEMSSQVTRSVAIPTPKNRKSPQTKRKSAEKSARKSTKPQKPQ